LKRSEAFPCRGGSLRHDTEGRPGSLGGLIILAFVGALFMEQLSVVLICTAYEPQRMMSTMIEYRKAGGFAGIEETLRIEHDGTVHFQRSISGTPEYDIKGRLDEKSLQDLVALADQADIFALQEEYTVKNQPFDKVSYQITYGRPDREKTVKIESTGDTESLGDVPERLRLLLQRLAAVIQDLLPKTP
jgi:hypothetical protein